MSAFIKQVDPHADYLESQVEIDQAVLKTLQSGWYILGEQVQAFETELADDLQVAHTIGCGNGTDALVLCLRALGIGPGDTVLTVSHTAVATVAAIEMVGAQALLIDIAPGRFNMDPAKLRDTILAHRDTQKLAAVIAVHLYGHPAPLEEISSTCAEFGLSLIEDCAQAQGALYHGRQVGTHGDMASFSFYPTKNLGALGDGGAVATHDDALATRVREIAQYGWRQKFISEVAGLNSRLDEVQAAILRVKLEKLHANNRRRQAVAASYTEALSGLGDLDLPVTKDNCTHVFHQYVLCLSERDALADYLKAQGIGTGLHYPQPVHTQPAYQGRVAAGSGGLENTEHISSRILSLPMYPQLDHQAVEKICQAVINWYRAGS